MIRNMEAGDLKQGMVVARDVFSDTGELIIGAKTVLSPRIIDRLQLYSVVQLPILFDDPQEHIKAQEKPDNKENRTSGQIMRDSESFKKFNTAFQGSMKETEQIIDAISMRGVTVDEKQISELVSTVLADGQNGIFVFDMLHCMRDMDDFTYAHSMSVALICKVFGEWLHMSEKDKQVLMIAGFLHDVGKTRIPHDIIYKPGRLTKTEFEIVKKHSEFGYDMLKDKDIDERIKLAALMHHERCDGTGYPSGLVSSEIDDIAKIVCIADSYEAMTANRSYREGLCPFSAIEEIEDNKLSRYDPQYILPLMEMIVQSYIGNNVKLSDDRIGEVIMINKESLGRPVVKMGYEYIDLAKNKDLHIAAIV